MADHPPFTQTFDLNSLGDAGREVALNPSPAERAAIAEWAGVNSVDAFSATVRLRRAANDFYEYDGSFSADVTQSCVVTLEPVKGHLTGVAAREFRVLPKRARRRPADEETVAAPTEDDDVEVSANEIVDLAAPVLEEFLLTIDPYPRAAGASFEVPDDADKPANPFSALEKLKGKE